MLLLRMDQAAGEHVNVLVLILSAFGGKAPDDNGYLFLLL
jgi:hypothetical protein